MQRFSSVGRKGGVLKRLLVRQVLLRRRYMLPYINPCTDTECSVSKKFCVGCKPSCRFKSGYSHGLATVWWSTVVSQESKARVRRNAFAGSLQANSRNNPVEAPWRNARGGQSHCISEAGVLPEAACMLSGMSIRQLARGSGWATTHYWQVKALPCTFGGCFFGPVMRPGPRPLLVSF